MLNTSRFSYLIDLMSSMSSSISTMIAGYRSLPSLISEEHLMIKAHTYGPKLEEIMLEKQTIGDSIERNYEDLAQCSQQVYQIWCEAECEGQATFPGDLSNAISMLAGIKNCLQNQKVCSDLEISIFDRQLQLLKDSLEQFKSLLTDVKPLLEINKLALSQVVHNYQMSTRALIEMCEQAQATYNPQGQQNRPAEGTSTIFVKA
ncbi:MAG: hypothetical protein NT027_07585 [Proteobacteria bacterium]|nr:hypothetical protein [Pseudomonadota bacterium]